MRSRVLGVLVVVCVLAGRASAGEWVVNAAGECVRTWSPSSLGRGPLAIVSGLTMPFRQLVGGGQAGMEPPDASAALRVPGLALLGLGTGTIESLVLIGGGLFDTLTGGYFAIVPDDVVEPSFAPMTPRFLAPPPQAPATDPCGRTR